MKYTELDLAQVDRRICAVERCLVHQRKILKQHIDAELDTEVPLQKLAEFEATLLDLKGTRKQIRDTIAAANLQNLLDLFTSLPTPMAARASSRSNLNPPA